MIDYALVWGGLIALAVLVYVLLDGFDLGIGILFPFLGGDYHKDLAMTSVAPVWDGNETWLILGGGGLFAVFPLAYAILMPAMYAPIIAMLLGLVLRGVAFEYRWRTQRGRFIWDWSFTVGSLIATLCQGIILGALAFQAITGSIEARFPSSPLVLILGGLLVGFGTRLGSGCTSGHGVCGMSRLSRRSLIATATFIVSGMVTVALANQLGWGW